MSLPLLVDMNLSPAWVDWLHARGCSAVHWSSVGNPCASDRIVLAWARLSMVMSCSRMTSTSVRRCEREM